MKKIIIVIVTLTATTALIAGVNSEACTGCHGADWSKSALNKSKVVSDMTHADISTALKGYKAGTYGRPMNMMQGQVAKYSDAELETFAQTIGK
ncbi:c-type cytochrome [Candidatus Sulfurimonas baltica]|uniref:Cytochrome C n=1 Tax=Candidatus Sulfurimonas baltica TaxID=2740404 RepID=A0A7S7RMJ8_9BACT|nr:cytochrome C [Candidatus Sulfurimonas baltica]QOY51493.1 cytochrome C [Candidatus Sulfurimonas baltica]